MTLGARLDIQLDAIKRGLRQPYQRFTATGNPRNVLRPVVYVATEAKRHGTVYSYERHKCRCEKCRAAKKAYMRRYTARTPQRLRNFREQPSLFQVEAS